MLELTGEILDKPALPRREQILAAAGMLFLRHGIAQVTTRQIAQAVGISQPSLYAHFRTRETIAVEFCQRVFAQLGERLAAASAAGGDPSARFRRMGHVYVNFGLEQEAAYRVAFMMDMPEHNEADRDAVVVAGVGAFAVLRALIAETHGDADLVAQSAWAGLHGLVALLLARRDFPWEARGALIARHVEGQCAAVYGLAGPSPHATIA
jgi:AcrR family transcriptional regulator